MLHGTYIDPANKQGAFYPDFLDLDLTATRNIGKWQIGPVAFGSIDLPTNRASYRRQGQFAVGGLVGYHFGEDVIQANATRDVVEQNYRGFDTRGWLRGIVWLYKMPESGGAGAGPGPGPTGVLAPVLAGR